MIGQKGVPATYGGVERHVEELSARLAAMGHEVTAYARRHYARAEKKHRGVALRVLPSLNTKHLDALTHTALAVCDAVRRDFDVIHFHGIGPAALAFVPRALFWKKRAVVTTVHALDWRRRKWGIFAKGFLRCCGRAAVVFPHRTICVSRTIADRFGNRPRLVHIPNGVEPPVRAPLRTLRAKGVLSEGYILWIGRFVPEKRVEDLIVAFRRLDPDRQLVLAGELDPADSYARSLKAAAEKDPRILFVGGLYGEEKAEALANAGIVVQPSELEGFPIALLEAMRYGKPVLASDIPEQLEAVRPGANGFVFRTGDADSLRKSLGWALSHPREIAAAGKTAESDARSYGWDPIARRTLAVYEEALAEARRR